MSFLSFFLAGSVFFLRVRTDSETSHVSVWMVMLAGINSLTFLHMDCDSSVVLVVCSQNKSREQSLLLSLHAVLHQISHACDVNALPQTGYQHLLLHIVHMYTFGVNRGCKMPSDSSCILRHGHEVVYC